MSKLQVDTIVDKEDKSAPTFSKGAIVTGVTTSTSFAGNLTGDVTGTLSGTASGLAGSPDIAVGQVTAGVTTFSSDINIADKIVHTGDTNTTIRFPAADTVTVETGGSERVRIDSSGLFGLGEASPSNYSSGANNLVITAASGSNAGITINNDSGGTDSGAIFFAHGSGANAVGRIRYHHDSDYMAFTVSNSERLRITNPGGIHFKDNAELVEHANVTAGKLSDNLTVNLDNGMVHLFTTAESTTSVPNIMSTVGINTMMSDNDVITVTLITTANASAYCTGIQIDGAAVTENWLGGSAPSDGGSSGVDIHTFSIIKTAANTYTVIGNQSKTS
jgi:hypothetical protein